MIVKNEINNLPRCLDSVRPFISAWLIMDTGSTDGTQEFIKSNLKTIPGKLVGQPFVNFGHNLTKALNLASAYKHPVLRLDADMTVDVTGKIELQADAGMVDVHDAGMVYKLPLLTNPKKKWKYVGVTHEYLSCSTPFTSCNVDNLTITHHADGSNRVVKFKRDLDLLLKEHRKDPADCRTVFYLAQTYKCLGNYDSAIHLYQKRSFMPGWEEEAWYAELERGRLLLTQDFDKGVAALLWAWERRPNRAEPLYELFKAYNSLGQIKVSNMFLDQLKTIPWPKDDTLFIDKSAYAFSNLES